MSADAPKVNESPSIRMRVRPFKSSLAVKSLGIVEALTIDYTAAAVNFPIVTGGRWSVHRHGDSRLHRRSTMGLAGKTTVAAHRRRAGNRGDAGGG